MAYMLMPLIRSLALGTVGLVLLLLFWGGTSAESEAQSPAGVWVEAVPQGFGDRHNSTAWTMQWWQGKLYVGTLRSFVCWRAAIWAAALPGLADKFYPPPDADADCTESPADLPMQAEIWRWAPETDAWERVYQSPQDVPIPGYPGKYVARDTGFRGMLVFTETGGTEALYVSGVSPREMYNAGDELPPPRILRSTNGVTFEAIPQQPGTFLGQLEHTGLRSGTIFNGRMYLINGNARGEGILIEAQEPSGGNDNFREVMPPGTTVWDVISFNGFLYVGVVSPDGFSLVKTDAAGTPPYSFTTVITAGGHLDKPSKSVVSLQEYQGRLYVGTYLPAELYRINPDDTWELLVGEPRQTPAGWKQPLSGLDAGFGWPYNVQVYRMHEHDGVLYLGTLDVSRELTELWPDPDLDERLRWHYGFDLYQTVDGHYFEPLTIDGFGDDFQIAARTFASTPEGLFFGSGSYWYGLRIWRQSSGGRIFLPIVLASSPDVSNVQALVRHRPVANQPVTGLACSSPPQRVEIESDGDSVILSWERPHNIARFRVFRSDQRSEGLRLPASVSETRLPAAFVEVGDSHDFFFVDTTTTADGVYYYYVLAEGRGGCLSPPSNLVRAPSLAPAVTLSSLERTIGDWHQQAGETSPSGHDGDLARAIRGLRADLKRGDTGLALARIEALGQALKRYPSPAQPAWRGEDLEMVLAKLERRMRLVQAGLISASDLE